MIYNYIFELVYHFDPINIIFPFSSLAVLDHMKFFTGYYYHHFIPHRFLALSAYVIFLPTLDSTLNLQFPISVCTFAFRGKWVQRWQFKWVWCECGLQKYPRIIHLYLSLRLLWKWQSVHRYRPFFIMSRFCILVYYVCSLPCLLCMSALFIFLTDFKMHRSLSHGLSLSIFGTKFWHFFKICFLCGKY